MALTLRSALLFASNARPRSTAASAPVHAFLNQAEPLMLVAARILGVELQQRLRVDEHVVVGPGVEHGLRGSIVADRLHRSDGQRAVEVYLGLLVTAERGQEELELAQSPCVIRVEFQGAREFSLGGVPCQSP